ncbi:hypothetical protein [Pseudohalocynthiibacter sp. F2068]|uniref:hypothetical protein n=1 Tax=Pseudohalocynthiibacter sp. F2068 TaxID=2926418 RepID=UPI001FF6352E|nr:hypothetical protein [Pseudohalocynthiibacter sp. F2068]MCK0103881.1 hypothetical protein [Pseudohalocynthiibacter sp. F2068]
MSNTLKFRCATIVLAATLVFFSNCLAATNYWNSNSATFEIFFFTGALLLIIEFEAVRHPRCPKSFRSVRP